MKNSIYLFSSKHFKGYIWEDYIENGRALIYCKNEEVESINI